MVHYIKKDTKIKPFRVASIIACIAVAVIAVVLIASGSNYQIEQSTVIRLSSGVDVALRGETMYNDEIYLTKDITIDDPNAQIGSSDFPFEGVFDGQGHTVYLTYSQANSDTSLFNYIAPGAIVKNVNFVFNNVYVSGNSFGGIAKINDGTIENCKIVFNNITLSSEGLFSPVAVVNRGTISGIVVQGTVSGQLGNIKEDKVLYGNVCVYNKGLISGAVVDAEYTGFACVDETSYREGLTQNVGISAVRFDDLEEGITEKAVAIIGEGQITSDIYDGIEFADEDEVYTYDKIIDELLFDYQYWNIGIDDVTLDVEEKIK